MEDTSKYSEIIERLNNNMPFGLFEEGKKCFFRDGTQVSYRELWAALRIVHNIPDGQQCGTLFTLCPNNYIGVQSCKFSKYNWKKATFPQQATA